MKIGILAWGSLLWEKGNLALANKWVLGGPKLPIEFSRVSVSRCGALTLVIDTKNGAENPTFFAESSFHNLGKAIRNLARREGTNPENIGYVTCRSEENRSRKPIFLGNSSKNASETLVNFHVEHLFCEGYYPVNEFFRWMERVKYKIKLYTYSAGL